MEGEDEGVVSITDIAVSVIQLAYGAPASSYSIVEKGLLDALDRRDTLRRSNLVR